MKIGKIVSVEYDKFRVRLFATTKHSTVSINGQVYYFGNIGSYLKANNATGDQILCEVSAILDYNQEGKQFSSFNLHRQTNRNDNYFWEVCYGCRNIPFLV